MPKLEDGVVPPFLGALQACTAVLLTLLYGIIARQANIIHEQSINDMSGLCVRLFLPALIMVKLGSELHIGIAMNYFPVFGVFSHQLWMSKGGKALTIKKYGRFLIRPYPSLWAMPFHVYFGSLSG